MRKKKSPSYRHQEESNCGKGGDKAPSLRQAAVRHQSLHGKGSMRDQQARNFAINRPNQPLIERWCLLLSIDIHLLGRLISSLSLNSLTVVERCNLAALCFHCPCHEKWW